MNPHNDRGKRTEREAVKLLCDLTVLGLLFVALAPTRRRCTAALNKETSK